MFRTALSALLAAAFILLPPAADAAERFHAPGLRSSAHIVLDAPVEKRSGAFVADDGRLQVGFVRPLDKSIPLPQWNAADGGFVTRIDATSQGAEGLRVKLELGTVPGAFEVRVRGEDGDVQAATIDPLLANEAWTPWTPGETQEVEIYSRVSPSPQALRVSALLHFTDSPFAAKTAAACTLSTACSATETAYDAAITERKKSMARIQYVDSGGAFVCTATLIDTPAHANFLLTANHCVNNATAANSVNAFWFYEETACNSGIAPAAPSRTNGGTQLIFTNFNVDSSLLLMSASPPGAAVFAPNAICTRSRTRARPPPPFFQKSNAA